MDLRTQVDAELAKASEQLSTTAARDPDSDWFAEVVVKDRNVLWQFVRERSFLTLLAAPEIAPTAAYDCDLLWRYIHGRPLTSSPAPDVAEFVSILGALKDKVSELFESQRWSETQSELIRLGLQRNRESR